MRIGVIIPDRGDRPRFIDNCLRMLRAQTLTPEIVEHVNYKPVDNECDITERYLYGYNQLRDKGLDLIAFIENDDWYSPVYLEMMAEAWQLNNRPDIIGLQETVYYHLTLKKYYIMRNHLKACAMNTLVKPDLKILWPQNNDPFTDIHLWQQLKGSLINFNGNKISIGIKHGVGLCGGKMHTNKLERYDHLDNNLSFLKYHLDPNSFYFYTNYFRNEQFKSINNNSML